MSGILIAGIGNLFLGDDAFGVEVVKRMLDCPLPDGVRVQDFGICGIDLTYALLDDIDLAILVDATQRGGAPGSLYVLDASSSLEPEGAAAQTSSSSALASPFLSPHEMQPDKVLHSVGLLGGTCKRVLLVGCEPQSFGTEDDQEGRIGLSAAVAASVGQAIKLIGSLIAEALKQQAEQSAATKS